MPADNTQNLLASTSGALSTTILGNGGPAPSSSAVTFFVNFDSGATICHFVASHASLSVCLVQLWLCLAQHRSWQCAKLFLFDHDDRQRFLDRNCQCKSCQCDTSVQIPELLSSSLISRFSRPLYDPLAPLDPLDFSFGFSLVLFTLSFTLTLGS